MRKEATQDDVGAHIIFVDPVGARHDALITAVWGTSCLNCVFVVKDPKATDNYGRKTTKQYTSIMHGNIQQAHGNYWLWPGEEREIEAHESVIGKVRERLAEPNPITE